MDPATNFQIVCGALQLIQFGIDSAKTCREIYQSGNALPVETGELDILTQRLRTSSSQVSSRLKQAQVQSQSQLSPGQQELCRAADLCYAQAGKLLKRLDSLKINGQPPLPKRRIAKQWAKWTLNKGKIEDDSTRLRQYQELFNTKMLVSIRYLMCVQIEVEELISFSAVSVGMQYVELQAMTMISCMQ